MSTDQIDLHPLDAAETYERRVLPARQLLHMLQVARDLARERHGQDWENHLDDYLAGELWVGDGPIDLLLALASEFEAAGEEMVGRIRASAEL